MGELEKIRTLATGLKVEQSLLELFQVSKEEELWLPGRNGTIHVYAYYPLQAAVKYPVFINLHGGGFVKGHREQDVVFCRNICQNAGCMVYDIDYKTAPEKKYPYALQEAYDVAEYLWTHAEELNLDLEKFVMAGHSAGGNLTLGCALLSGKRSSADQFKLSGLICDYPPVDLVKDPAEKRYADRPGMRPPVADARMYNEWYIDPEYRKESTASPIYATEKELSDLPPVLLITAEDDVLGEEAEQLAHRMIEAGTTLLVKRIKGAEHGFVVRRGFGYEEAETLIFAFLNQLWK